MAFDDGTVKELALARQEFHWQDAGEADNAAGDEGEGEVRTAAVRSKGKGVKRKREGSGNDQSEKTAGDFQRKMDEISRLVAAGVLTVESGELAKSRLVAEFVSRV